jgi:hypothetical protein
LHALVQAVCHSARHVDPQSAWRPQEYIGPGNGLVL